MLIPYYSGVGNTKMVATKIFASLQNKHEVSSICIKKLSEPIAIAKYDALAIGFFFLLTKETAEFIAGLICAEVAVRKSAL